MEFGADFMTYCIVVLLVAASLSGIGAMFTAVIAHADRNSYRLAWLLLCICIACAVGAGLCVARWSAVV